MKEGKRICDKCGGEGTLPEEPLEPVLAVRVIKGYHSLLPGDVISVRNDSWRNTRYWEVESMLAIPKASCEVIPDYDKTEFRLRKRDEDKQVGDMFGNDVQKWCKLIRATCPRQQLEYIYITPLKPATPDPSADCLPGFVAFPVEITPAGKYLEAYVPHVTCLEELPGDVRWSGRYGYKREDGTIWWVKQPRVYRHDTFKSTLALDTAYDCNIPFLPSFVEMKKESDE